MHQQVRNFARKKIAKIEPKFCVLYAEKYDLYFASAYQGFLTWPYLMRTKYVPKHRIWRAYFGVCQFETPLSRLKKSYSQFDPWCISFKAKGGVQIIKMEI